MDEKPNSEAIREWLQTQVKLFDRDPADTDYQRGYEQALYDALTFSTGMLSSEYRMPRSPV